MLTERQRQLLEFIEDHIRLQGFPPSIREMAAHMGIRSTNGVNDHLKALERKGYLTRQAGLKSRAITLKTGRAREDGAIVAVPILGRVAAGQPVLAQENLEGHLQLDRALVGKGREVFALRVRGDSMIEKGIFDGDFVLVRRQDSAEPGQMVVALIDGEATVKMFRPLRDQILFEPANPRMESIVVHRAESRQIQILGVVTGVFRRVDQSRPASF